MEKEFEEYHSKDLTFTQDEKNIIFDLFTDRISTMCADIVRHKTNNTVFDAIEAEKANRAMDIAKRMESAGWRYPADYTPENYQ